MAMKLRKHFGSHPTKTLTSGIDRSESVRGVSHAAYYIATRPTERSEVTITVADPNLPPESLYGRRVRPL